MTADLRAFRSVLARRWPVIVPAVVLVPLLTLLLAGGQSRMYSAHAQVLLTYSNVGASVNGVASTYPSTAPDRNVATQAALARNPAVAQQALKLAGVNMSATDLLKNSSVSTSTSDDLLTFAVDGSPPQRAMTLATNYAQAYTIYRGHIVRQTINSSLSGINRRLAELSAAGETGTPTYRFLSHDQQELSGIQAAGNNDAVVVQRAQSASVVGPGSARSAALGLGLGIALAAALAFLMETLDKRASVEEIGQRLRLPNLAIIPDTSRWRRLREPLSGNVGRRRRAASQGERAAADGELVDLTGATRSVRRMRAADTPGLGEPTAAELGAEALAVVRDPYGRTADAYRVLKSSLELARLEHDFKSLLFTSACRPGRSETVANLAVTLVQSGRRVLVCDLHAGRASITELFRLEECPGVTDVALGRATLEDAVVSVSASSLIPTSRADTEGLPGGARLNGFPSARDARGHLGVLPFGGPPPHSGFLGTRDVAELVEELGHAHADLVLIDAPPLLVSGEAQTLGVLADAMVVVLVDPVRPAILTDVAATLSQLPARPLGYITVGVVREGGESRGGGGHEVRPSSPAEISRPPRASSAANGHGAVTRGLASMRASERAPAAAGRSEGGASSGAATPTAVAEAPTAVAEAPTAVVEESAPVAQKPTVVVEEPAPVAQRPTVVVEEPPPLAEEPPPVAPASIVVTDAQPSVVGLSRLSTHSPSAAADVWRVTRGMCAITGHAAMERFPQVGRITGEMKHLSIRQLRRSPQARIEAWSTLTALLR
jgi:Mrp family chromosome partitioning ATPase/capsular polysaccharide biosynthesis protein